tara:strand:+ start:23 stop:166 length:144 start_codon:yes stop_codon:yes gene_type:complete
VAIYDIKRSGIQVFKLKADGMKGFFRGLLFGAVAIGLYWLVVGVCSP